jgi:hypothetical protein
VILTDLLLRIEKNIPFKNEINHNISKTSVGWHLDHTIKVINTVSAKTIDSNSKNYISKFNFKQWVIFKLGFFPRGKAKAPKVVLPPEKILEADIMAQLEHAYSNLKILELLPENAFFEHHLFGMLSKKETLRFLKIHTNHHLKIINDILKA